MSHFELDRAHTALECLGKAIEPHPNPLLGRSLDMASAAVLIAALGAAAVGAIVLLPRLLIAMSRINAG